MKALIKPLAKGLLQRLGRAMAEVNEDSRNSLSQQVQRQLAVEYIRARAENRNPFPAIRDAGFRMYSQFEEDGIVLYVLTMIGLGTRKVVEMCAGDGTECMATNLILNHGFEGFLFDGNSEYVERGRRFFQGKKDSFLIQPRFEGAWITRQNVNDLLRRVGASGEVDLFSLDIDGNDYWVWEAIEEIRPRLCVFETNDFIPSHLSLTIPYDPDFFYKRKPPHERDYRGVSLQAMVKLCRKKGYRLIGAHRYGFNVFFLRDDLGQTLFPEVQVDQVHDNRWTRFGQAERWPVVKDLPWVEV